MIRYKDREKKIKKTRDFKSGDEWYSYVVNEWIPLQPDKIELMDKFIYFDFNMKKFVKHVVFNLPYY